MLDATLAALAGALLGWWPLVDWARRSLAGSEAPAAQPVPVASADAAAAANAAAPIGAPSLSRRASPARREVPPLTSVRARIAVALATGSVCGLAVWCVGLGPALPAVLAFAAAAMVLAVVDLVEQRLPNRVMAPAVLVVAVLLVVASALSADWLALAWAAAGGAALFGLFLIVAVVSPPAMGMGDVKLAGFIGLLLGWLGLEAWLIGLVAAFVIGGAVAVTALALRRVTLRGSIPFGPSMLAGALLAVLVAG